MPRHRAPDDVDCPRGPSTRTCGAPERLSDMVSPEVVQQRPDSWAVAKPSRKRGAAPTINQQLQMLVDRGDCETDANGCKRGVREMMANKWGNVVASNYADRMVAKIRAADPDGPDALQRKERSDKGVPRVLTPRKQARMHELSDEWNGEWSDADMAAQLNAEFGTTISPKGINYHTNWVLPHEWDLKANVRAVPWLSKEHRTARETWAREALKPLPPGVVEAHVDEKWFYTVRTRRRAKVSQRGRTGSTKKLAKALRVRHKGYVPKVMFLAACARPRPEALMARLARASGALQQRRRQRRGQRTTSAATSTKRMRP